jgi:hypothetical protein
MSGNGGGHDFDSVTSFPSDDEIRVDMNGNNYNNNNYNNNNYNNDDMNALVSQTQAGTTEFESSSPVRPMMAASSQVDEPATAEGGEEGFEDALEHEEQANDAADGSGISGKGMWDAWTRSFDTPLLAFLDLLDNAVDASWSLLEHSAEKPRIQIDIDNQIGSGGIWMRNASKYIPPLSEVLQVYKSKKGSAKDSIGENGIGVKHACASLSDLSLVFCKRDMEYLSVGILMKDLQQDKAIVLPSFEWHTSVNIPEQLEKMCTVTHPHTWGKALEAYGDGDLEDGMNQCFRHMMAIQEGDWKDYPNVFTMVLNELKHEGLDSTTDAHVEDERERHREPKTAEEKSKELLHDLQKKMPYLYLHLNNFEVKIQKTVIKSTYWERRLVELTKFELEIPTDEHFAKMHPELYAKGKVTQITDPKKSVRFFCGFNPFRSSDEGNDEAAMGDVEAETDLGMVGGRNVNSASMKLYLYSRQSGRLIKVEHDPRSRLGLGAGSTNFNQGLTVIIDDYNGTIPLNPTKQDTSYGHSSHGQIHSDNVDEWTAAITHFYWMYHFEMVANESKRALSEAVGKRKDAIKALISQPSVAPFSYGTFIEYQDLSFRMAPRKGGLAIRTTKPMRKACYATFAGSDDMSICPLIRLDEDAAGLALQGEAKRRANREAKRTRESLDEEEVAWMAQQRAQAVSIANNANYHHNPASRVTGMAMANNNNFARQNVATVQDQTRILQLEQEVANLRNQLEASALNASRLTMQRNNEKFRADKLENDMRFMQQQMNVLMAQKGGSSSSSDDAAAMNALMSQLEDANRKNKALRDEIVALKASGATISNSSNGDDNSKEEIVKLNKQVGSLLQQVQYYKMEKDSARQQIKLLNEEKDRMEARVQQLEATQFDLI